MILRRNGAYDAGTRAAGTMGATGATGYATSGTTPDYRTTTTTTTTGTTGTTGATGTRGQGATSGAGTARTAGESEQVIELREEEVVPTKQTVQAGEVEVRKTVQEEQREVPVNLRHEEVYIDRHEVDQPVTGEVGELTDETIRVPVYEEQAHLEKRGRVAEEVVIGKDVEQERQTLTGTVRREEVDVDLEGDVDTRGWDNARSDYRTRWQQRYDSSGERWEDYEPAYRYGHEMRSNPRYRGRNWDEVEPELRRDWESRGEQAPWEKAADAIRDTWNDVTSDDESRTYDRAKR